MATFAKIDTVKHFQRITDEGNSNCLRCDGNDWQVTRVEDNIIRTCDCGYRVRVTRYGSDEDTAQLIAANESDLTSATTWERYVKEAAAENGVRFGDALAIFQMLGPTEAFDGFITTLADMGDEDFE